MQDLTETGIDAIFDKISKIKSAGVIERYGFHEFLAFAKEVRNKVSDDIWLEVGWDILEGMGLEELYGCDYDILEALENIPPESDLIDIQSFLRHTLVFVVNFKSYFIATYCLTRRFTLLMICMLRKIEQFSLRTAGGQV